VGGGRSYDVARIRRPAGGQTPRDLQDVGDREFPSGPHPMEEEEAASAPHGQPDLPAPSAAPDGGRHPPGNGEREAGGRPGLHVSEPAHRQGEPAGRPPPCRARPALGTHATEGFRCQVLASCPGSESSAGNSSFGPDPVRSRSGLIASLSLAVLILKVG
jgi:hypothetical protein